MANNLSESIYIRDLIDLGQRSEFNLSRTTQFGQYTDYDINIPLSNIFLYKYRNTLLELSESLTLSEKYQKMYKYRPKKLSYDLYNTVEYWYILMILNNVTSISQFNLKEVRYVPIEKLPIIDSILRREQQLSRNGLSGNKIIVKDL